MLGNLLKYELKSTARIFLPLYAALIVMSFVLGVFTSNAQNFGLIGVIVAILYGALMMAVIVVTIVVVIQRFYKNLLCEEGYLMFTLPVKSSQHSLSKVIAALVWESLSVVIGGFSVLCIMFVSAIPFSVSELFRSLKEILAYFREVNIGVIVLLSIIMLLCSAAANTQMVYAALSVGHIFEKKPILMSVACYIGFIIVLQIIVDVFYKIVDFSGVFDSLLWYEFFQTPSSIYTALGLGILSLALMFGVFFFVTTITLKKKLNLA